MIQFLHFLAWASHFNWLCYTGGSGSHVVYGGNVVDCIHVAQANGPHAFCVTPPVTG